MKSLLHKSGITTTVLYFILVKQILRKLLASSFCKMKSLAFFVSLVLSSSFIPAKNSNPIVTENAPTGRISLVSSTGSINVSDTYKNLPFWRNATIATLGSGQTVRLASNTLGYEWNPQMDEGKYPNGRIPLSKTLLNGKTHNLSLYRHGSGVLVFGAGTMQWSWGLDANHDGLPFSSGDIRTQQATENFFADKGVLPGTIQTGLVANSSTDNTAPVSTITSPSNNASLASGSTVNITGTASDADGAVVGVEVSVDGGLSWSSAIGTTNWSYSWTPVSTEPTTIHCRAFDDNGNMETAGTVPSANAIKVNFIVSPYTVFEPSDGPDNLIGYNDGVPIELGMKFSSDVSGYVVGVRFFKSSSGTGSHKGSLWTRTGTLLTSATFVGETASGWQQVYFGTPIYIDANTTYVVSYRTDNFYVQTQNYFLNPLIKGHLKALADKQDGPNGVNSTPVAFPTAGTQKSNYWVDVVFEPNVQLDVTPPLLTIMTPVANAKGVNSDTKVNGTFNEPIDPSTVDSNTFKLLDPLGFSISGTVTYDTNTRTIAFNPLAALAYSTVYTATLKGGIIKDLAGNPLVADYSWSFTTGGAPSPSLTEGPGGPILLISHSANPFSRYPVEILRAEGLNEFSSMDISQVGATTLNNYDVVILGEMSLTASDATMLTDWVNAGGTLIVFRPDAKLQALLGITAAGGTLSDKYLLVDTASKPGAGIVAQTIQFHGTADQYKLNGATALATLYSDATTATVYPAVTTNNVGSNGGKAIAFTYDLAKSVVYTRQGNPEWAGQERDGYNTIRPDDQFFPDWIDLNKVAIPQADEQQHLLSNIILKENLRKKPLPRIWFLPKGLKAAVVMTGDDHGAAGLQPRFDVNISESTPGCSVDDWDCIRSTAYLYVKPAFTNAQAVYYNNLGFEVALHVSTNCLGFNEFQYQNFITDQLGTFKGAYPGIPLPTTNRNHCMVWSGWSMTAEVEAANGFRFDVNYYYWPASWALNRPGMFTGSGVPMRFAKLDGTIIDCYQAVTQMPDESGFSFPFFIDALLDKAIGPEGYYGVFTTNMHFDNPNPASANAIVASAKARGVPVVTSKQMLNWLDGRNNSSFKSIQWSNNQLSFGISAATGSRNMKAMIPLASAKGTLNSIAYNGSPINFTSETIKGIQYAFFDATLGNGTYVAHYNVDDVAPFISDIVVIPNENGTATISWTTDEAGDSRIDYGTTNSTLNANRIDEALVTDHSITLTGLSPSTTYYYRVSSEDAFANRAAKPISPATLSFSMPGPCASDVTTSDFNAGTVDSNTLVIPDGDGAVSLKPKMNEEFEGTAIPSGWTDAIWDAQAEAKTTFSAGQVTVNGTHLIYDTSVGPGTSLEFMATFTKGNSQNVGFTADAAFNGPWVVIGRGDAGDDNVYARTNTDQIVSLGSTLLDRAHSYRIQWLLNGAFEFYVDGVLIATPGITQTLSANMGVQISDYPAAGVGLSVDSIHLTPYAASGTFTSRVFDAGLFKTWGTVSWTENVPAGTTLQLSQRQSDSAVAILTAPWTTITSNGAKVGGISQYIQYKADFTTSTAVLTPILKDIVFICGLTNTLPVVTAAPVSQSRCAGDSVSFVSAANGNPLPTVQWQISSDSGTSWSDLVSATNPTYTFTTSPATNAFAPNTANKRNQYRAVWTNEVGTTKSKAATLEVYALPTATIGTVTNPICEGDIVSLQLSNATGSSPYTLVVNGNTYSNITIGQTFTTINTAAQSIWGTSGSPIDPSEIEKQTIPIEVGTKFRSSVDGYIVGVRFYKGITNTGQHTANLWTAAGALVATANFTAETVSGWQEVRFATPVAIQANTTYVASYFSKGGNYAFSTDFFAGSGVTNGSLTAFQTGVDGPNGVYKYGGGFPEASNNANYWVDVLFSQINSSSLVFELTSVIDANGCTNNESVVINKNITVPAAPVLGLITQPTNLLPTGSVELTGLPAGNWTINPEGIIGNTESVIISGLTAGSYRFTVTNEAGCVSPASANAEIYEPKPEISTDKLIVYPNPSNGPVYFVFKTVQDSNVSIDLFTINGLFIFRIFEGYVNAVEEHTIISNIKLLEGIYIYRMNSMGEVKTGKLIIDN